MIWPDAFTEPDPCPICGRRNCLDSECDAIRHAETAQHAVWDDYATFTYEDSDVDWLEAFLDDAPTDTDTLPF